MSKIEELLDQMELKSLPHNSRPGQRPTAIVSLDRGELESETVQVKLKIED